MKSFFAVRSTFILTFVVCAFLLVSSSCNAPDPGSATNEINAETAGNPITTVGIDELLKKFDTATSKVQLYNFWATWCAPCVKELPYFEAMREKYASKGVEIILISLDDVEQLDAKVLPFLERKKLKSELLLLDAGNPNVWIDQIAPEWSGSIPGTLIINKSKGIRDFYEQSFTAEELETLIQESL